MNTSRDVVLGGGGIKGFGHIGFLQAVQEADIPIGNMVGVSVGALVATLYKNGFTIEQITREFFNGIQRRMNPALWLRSLSKPDPLMFMLGGWFPDVLPPTQDMVAELGLKPHPELKILAYDMIHRKPVLFDGDYDLATALAASCALPGVFRPVPHGGRGGLLVDGALFHRNPIEFSGAMPLVSKLGFATMLPTEPLPPLEMLAQLREIYGASHQQRHDVDEARCVLVEIETPDVSGLAFSISRDRCLRMVANGYETTRDALAVARCRGKL